MELEAANAEQADEAASVDSSDEDVVIVKTEKANVHAERAKLSQDPINADGAGSHPNASLNPTTASSHDTTPHVEFYSADKKSELFCLEMSHLAKENENNNPITLPATSVPSLKKMEDEVRQYPFISWPTKLIFIHVSAGASHRNLYIFSQATLETAFQDWRRNESTVSVFRVYVCEQEGPPQRITLD